MRLLVVDLFGRVEPTEVIYCDNGVLLTDTRKREYLFQDPAHSHRLGVPTIQNLDCHIHTIQIIVVMRC
jgi:hypothetical protein